MHSDLQNIFVRKFLEEVRDLEIRHEHSNIANVLTISIGICHAKVLIVEHINRCSEFVDQALYEAE